MTYRISFGLPALLLMLLAWMAVPIAAYEPDKSYIDVTDYGADGTDENDDRSAFNNALAEAAGSTETVTVYVPGGNYYLSGTLFIYSNTILQLSDNAVIYEMPGFAHASMIVGSHLDDNGKRCTCAVGSTTVVCNGSGYSKCHDITIDGGSWIAYKDPETGVCPGSAIVAIRHAQNITLKNMTCKNASGHAVNLSGVDTATVSNVTFDTANAKTSNTAEGLYTKEFIHLDYCTVEGEPTYGCPFDGTAARNITVENCSFSNGYSGVGNHHASPDNYNISSNITVKGCTFTHMGSYAVGEYSVDGLTVSDCTASDCMIFALVSGSSNVVLQNNTFDAMGANTFDSLHRDRSGINITGAETVNISGNTVKNTCNSGISVTNSSDVNIISNSCSGTGSDGIVVKNSSAGLIDHNTVENSAKYGIEYRSSTGMTISSNNVSGAGSALYIIGDNVNSCDADVTDNILNSSAGYDLYLGLYSDSCFFSGNTLVNYTFLKLADSFTGTLNLPTMDNIIIESTAYVYTGEKINPPVTVTDTLGRILTNGTDYELYYKECTNAGTARIIVQGKSRSIFYDQEKTITFTILPKTVTPKVVLSHKSYVFDNDTKEPSVKVYNGKELIPDSQYTVTYGKGRKQAGTYTVKVKLKNNYSGSGNAKFTIKKAKQDMKVTPRKTPKTVKYSDKKSRHVAASSLLHFSGAHGSRTYKLVSGKKKYFSIAKSTGKITIKPKTPAGIYKLKIKITASGGRSYKPKTVTKTVKIRVKD